MDIIKNVKDFDQKLVDKIKLEKIIPKPRWHFLLKNYVVWGIGALALLIGAAAISVMMYFLKYSGWEIREKTNKSLVDFFLLTLPYFWIIFLGIFIFILYYNLKHTKKGYRYPLWLVASASVVASVVLGGLLFLGGLGQAIDDILSEQAPLYDTIINRQVNFWFNPDEGRLVGLVSKQNEDNSFNVIDPQGNEWQVSVQPDRVPLNLLKLQQPVNLIGEITADHKFEAKIVRPVHPGRKFLQRSNNFRSHSACSGDDCLVIPGSGNRQNFNTNHGSSTYQESIINQESVIEQELNTQGSSINTK